MRFIFRASPTTALRTPLGEESQLGTALNVRNLLIYSQFHFCYSVCLRNDCVSAPQRKPTDSKAGTFPACLPDHRLIERFGLERPAQQLESREGCLGRSSTGGGRSPVSWVGIAGHSKTAEETSGSLLDARAGTLLGSGQRRKVHP